MRRLGLEPGAVEAVVLSHIHGDHAGGLDRFLDASPHVDVYLPAAFPASFQEAAARRGARVHPVEESGRLFGSVYSTGGLDGGQAEQALIMDTSEGLVVVTGCAHPGIVPVAEAARRLTGRPIHLLMGGFHLRDESEAGIRRIITGLRALDVEKVAPSHCTGETARALLREAWGEDFIEGGLGAVIEVAAR
jgi:7,8-dihydropterin-6-yl-methyl-4-(beta-D-ribofuranosyl)aminobenzene 5'-phosphate synthase